MPDYLPEPLDDARYEYAQLDLRAEAGVAETVRRFSPDVVISTAAALRDEAWSALFESNVQATIGLLSGLSAAGASPRVVLTSSGSIYGCGSGQLPFEEDGPAEPIDLYGASKRAAEDVARILCLQAGLALVRARVFNLMGPGLQHRHLPARLAGEVAATKRGLAAPVLRVGPLTATRDFVDVRDAADALSLLAAVPNPAAVYNVASGVETPGQAVLDTLLDLAGLSGHVDLEVTSGRPVDIPRACADVRRLQALGFVPRYDLRASLGEMLDYCHGLA